MMYLRTKTLATTAMVLAALAARAQISTRGSDPSARETRAHTRVFERARRDLDRAAAFTAPNSGDRDRLAFARNEVNECARLMATGVYDRRTFGETMAAFQRVIDLNQLSDRDRRRLQDDLKALRDVQASLEAS